jgi:peptide/nickel transport system substrate-binding protein
MQRGDLASELQAELSRRAFLGRGAVAAGAMGLYLSGCGGQSSAPASPAAQVGRAFSPGPTASGTPVSGGTLRIGAITSGPAESINLLNAGLVSEADFTRTYALYETLVSPIGHGLVGPSLATSWETNSEATLWTFHLRRGVTFHSGHTFTADDVVYTVQRMWNNAKNGEQAALASMIDFAGVRKLDAYTIQIPLNFGIAQFPTCLLLPQTYIGQAGATNWADGNGTGPFMLESFHPGVQSVFRKNPNYWQHGLPYLDTLIVDSSFTTEEDRLNALLAGQLDIVFGVDPDLAAVNAGSGRIVVGNEPGPALVEMGMRVADGGVFLDARVREAFHLIPNRPRYVTDAFDGYATIGNDCCGNTCQYHASDLQGVHDPERARALLKAAGHEGLAITLATSPLVPGMTAMATLFKQDAALAGVNVSLRVLPEATYATPATGFFHRLFDSEFYYTGENSLAFFYITSGLKGGIYNITHWAEGPVAYGPNNSLLFEALRETDPVKAAEKWHAVQTIDNKSGPYLIPAFPNYVDAYATQVRGVQTTTAGPNNNWNYTNAWVAS